MKLDLTQIINGAKEEIELDIKEDLDNMKISLDEITWTEPVRLKGKVYHKSQKFFIEGTIQTKGILRCHRCLEPFEKTITATFHEELIQKNEETEIEDGFVIDHNGIDLSQIIKNELVLSIPMKIICREDCKGLCRVCGKNLNKESCNCEHDRIDPRLAKLKDLLQ